MVSKVLKVLHIYPRSMLKRGQITIFIILGVIILLVILFSLFLVFKPKQQHAELTGSVSQQASAIIQNCLDSAAEKGVYLVALQGGYVNPFGDPKYWEGGDGLPQHVHYYYNGNPVPFVVDNDKSSLRSLQEIELVLANYALVEAIACANFSHFENDWTVTTPRIDLQKIKFDYSKTSVPYSSYKVNSIVEINPENILFEITYPVKFTKGKQVFVIEKFSINLPMRFDKLHATAGKLVEKIKKSDRYNIKEDCAEYATPEKSLNVYLVEDPEHYAYVVRLIEISPLKFNKPPLKFQFAVKNTGLTGACIG